MKVLNTLERAPIATKVELGRKTQPTYNALLLEGFGILLRLISPVTPHICHQLWRDLGYGEDILDAPWPEPDAGALVQDQIELVVQVNGKKRGSVRVPREADNKAIEGLVLADAEIAHALGGKAVKKFVVVPGRLVNVVV